MEAAVDFFAEDDKKVVQTTAIEASSMQQGRRIFGAVTL
jgi:hypothetical protein